MSWIVEGGRRRWRAAAQARLTLRVYSGEGAKKGRRMSFYRAVLKRYPQSLIVSVCHHIHSQVFVLSVIFSVIIHGSV